MRETFLVVVDPLRFELKSPASEAGTLSSWMTDRELVAPMRVERTFQDS